jgi:hypothetical protein
MSTVEMDHGAHFRNIFAGAIEVVIYRQAVVMRQVVYPIDCDGLAASGCEGWARHGSIESPQNGRGEIAMHLLTKLRQSDPVLLGTGSSRDGFQHARQG